MERIWLIPVLASILILGMLGSQEAFALTTAITDQATCENAPVLGDFQSGTCILDGTHTIPVRDFWDFRIDSKVTGTVDVNGILRVRSTFSNSGTIDVIGTTTVNRGQMIFFLGTNLDNECNGIINLIAGTSVGSGSLLVSGQSGFVPIFNNFGTITGTNSNLANLRAVIDLRANPEITVFNNHGTLTAPVSTSAGSGNAIFNDNLQDQCVLIGGTNIPIDQTALLLAGVQSISMWMIPVVIAGIGIGIFVIKRRK